MGNQSLFNKFIKYYIGYLSPFFRKKTIQQELNPDFVVIWGGWKQLFCATYGDLSFRGTDKLALLYSILFERREEDGKMITSESEKWYFGILLTGI